jgi:hypothetical protein
LWKLLFPIVASLSFLLTILNWLLTLGVLIPGLMQTARARRTAGPAAAKAMVGCGVLLVNLLITVVWSLVWQMGGSSLLRGTGTQDMSMVYGVYGLLHTVLYCVGVGYLIAGVVGASRAAPPPYPQQQQQPYPPQQTYAQQPQQPYPPQPQQPYPPQQQPYPPQQTYPTYPPG